MRDRKQVDLNSSDFLSEYRNSSPFTLRSLIIAINCFDLLVKCAKSSWLLMCLPVTLFYKISNLGQL